MCVQAKRSALFSRASFLAAAGAAAAPLLVHAAADAAPAPALPAIPSTLSPGNARAAAIAHGSPLVRARYAQALALARSIGDAPLRADVLDLLERPIPSYAARYRTADQRTALRDALAREGFIKADDPVSGIFPPGTGEPHVVQPFWSAPGSDLNSHHSYPGGLLMHELFNSTMAANFEHTYDALSFGGRRTVDRDTVIAAAFYHDIMKTVVFQFEQDGSFLPELSIGDTGGHHCLSGAEAIARGRDARFVTVLLSAHAAPSLGDEDKVVEWCRAAAMIAGVDPVEYGLVKKTADGYVLAAMPPIETFVSNLSDHDFVLTIPAVRAVAPQLAALNRSTWFRHQVFSRTSAVALYEELLRGEDRFRKAVDAAGV
jgi:hypothetical protein